MAKGNSLAHGPVKEAANGMCIMPLVPILDLSQFDPEYSIAGLEKAKWYMVLMKMILIGDREE